MNSNKRHLGGVFIFLTFLLTYFLQLIPALLIANILQLVLFVLFREEILESLKWVLVFKVKRTIFVFLAACYSIIVYQFFRITYLLVFPSLGEFSTIVVLLFTFICLTLLNLGFVPDRNVQE